MVNYYVDFVNGKNSWGGQGPSPGAASTTNRPVKSLHYMVGSSNTLLPGDKIYISGGQTWTMGSAGASGNEDLTFLLDGDINNYITVMGCYPNGTNQNKPTINFGRKLYGGSLLDDNYWRISNLEFRRSARDSYGNFRAAGTSVSTIANGLIIDNCRFSGSIAYTYPRGLYIGNFDNVIVSSCRFYGNVSSTAATTRSGYGLYLFNITKGKLIDSIFSGNTTYNLWIQSSFHIDVFNCKFLSGNTASTVNLTEYGVHLENYNTCSFYCCTSNCNISMRTYNYTNIANCKRCTFRNRPLVYSNYNSSNRISRITLENYNNIPENDICITWLGTTERNSYVYSGATSSIQISTNQYVRWTNPFIYYQWDPEITEGGFKSWYSSPGSKTITCNVYVSGSWNMSAGLPKASSLYIKSRYYDSTTGKYVLTGRSTQDPSLNSWKSLTNTIPDTSDGFVYTNVFLHKRIPSANARLAIGKGVYIDPKVVLS